MQNIDTFLTLDVYDYDLSPSTIKAIALDSNTRSVTAYITQNGQPYDVGQSNVTLTVIRPDGVGAQVTGEAFEYEASVEDTTVTRHGAYAELSPATLAKKGTLRAQFMFVSGEQVLRTEIFTISCGEALDASTDTWAGEYQGYNLDELVKNVNTAVGKVDAMEDDVSDLKEGLSDNGIIINSPYFHGPFCTKSVDFSEYYVGKSEYDAGLKQTTLYQEVIALYDALMSDEPTHITKTELGLASGGQTIYEYAFSPYAYTGSLGSDAQIRKNPVILMDAGIHGFEKNSVYALYYFLNDLVNNWQDDPVLTAIRQNVIIKVIPVSNPDGFNRDRYYNANDVNINRNFACTGWTPISSSDMNNSGAEPFDQPESRILRDWVLNNKSNLMLYLNLHTNGRYNVSAYSDVNSCMPKFAYTDDDLYFAKIAEVVRRHIQIQSVKIPQMYSTARGTYGKYQQETGSTGTMAVWLAETAKVIGMTFEMFNGVKVDGTQIIGYFSAESKKMCSEMIGNMVAQTIVEYSEG